MSESDKADSTDDQTPEDQDTDAQGTPLGDNLGVHIPSIEDDVDQDDPQFEVKIDFGTFLIGFYQTGMMNLGRIEHPETGQTIRDMEAAKHNVEILTLLQEKTEGNLSAEEQNLIQRLLYDLRVAYVEERDKKKKAN
ncbi:MAG: DUF1844 domain-containing protein [Myxococcota bacterium]